MGDEVLAYPLSWLEEGEAQQAPTPKETPKAASAANVAREVSQITTKAFSCPKCGHGYAAGDSECEKCGVVFMKIKEKSQAPSYSASIEVRELWDAVLEDYDNFEKHQNFINAASADRSLEYAAEHYAKILEVCPQDELAQKAQKEVNALAFARFESQIVKNGPSKNSFFGDIPLSFRKFRLTSFVIFLCAVVIATGIILPHQRNLVGAGTSVMFFIFALRYFFRVL
jgi:predicted  nucleic acid-binding Zn-ribbon protein